MDDYFHIDTRLLYQLSVNSPFESLSGLKLVWDVKYSIMEFNPTQDRLGLRLLSCTSKGHITPREKLVVKLGTMIPVFGCLPFFTKYLDQQAITNAYVSYVDCTPGVADNPGTHTP